MPNETFTDTGLDAGMWASRGDCRDVLKGIDGYCDQDTARLNRAIASATDYAQGILRAKWPESWPFGAAPESLRRRVAVIAVFEVFFGSTLPDELEWLERERDRADDWLEGVAEGTIVLDQTGEESTADRVFVTERVDMSKTTYGFRHAAD